MKFIDIPSSNQRDFINQYSDKTNINPVAVEKDWWVSAVMRTLFVLPYADRHLLGFGGELSRTQASDKLRRTACTFVRETLQMAADLSEYEISHTWARNIFMVGLKRPLLEDPRTRPN